LSPSQELDSILFPLGGIVEAKSKGGKVFYGCPQCKQLGSIKKELIYHQNSYLCLACNQFGPWRERLKISKKRVDVLKGKA
jgi:hypothetical protein